MNIGEKLQILRKSNGFSQEDLAEKLGVSRQAVSKWESGQTSPDINKIIMISGLYNITIDSLLKDELDINLNLDSRIEKGMNSNVNNLAKEVNIKLRFESGAFTYEYRSKRTLFGLPLVHINIGRGLKKANGIIAVGNCAVGVISFGIFSLGLISVGAISAGLVAMAGIALGLLLAVGCVAIGTFAIGAVAIGIYSLGALAIGKYSVGAAAIASNVAVGDYANGNVAIGRNTVGNINMVTYDFNTRELCGVKAMEVKETIRSVYSNIGDIALRWLTFFFK
ncbi:helix-turn-helix domain-containing protein [Clostridium paraputrificum]|uniref:helix-turn-helix domain-containing protein n=1 Tax=Clostridium TaxID=1485 RepID=UPI003D349D85